MEASGKRKRRQKEGRGGAQGENTTKNDNGKSGAQVPYRAFLDITDEMATQGLRALRPAPPHPILHPGLGVASGAPLLEPQGTQPSTWRQRWQRLFWVRLAVLEGERLEACWQDMCPRSGRLGPAGTGLECCRQGGPYGGSRGGRLTPGSNKDSQG